MRRRVLEEWRVLEWHEGGDWSGTRRRVLEGDQEGMGVA
jgi:hypothetical protein